MRDLVLDLDPSLGRRASVEHALRDAIRSGQLGEGSLLPSSRSLAADLNVARATVVSAYDQLAIEGYVVPRQGFGTTVALGHQRRAAVDDDTASHSHFAVDFRPGEPDTSSFPRRAWLRSVRRVVTTSIDEVFGYGDPQGRIELRCALATYLGRARAVAAEPEALSVFGGATSAIGFLAEAFARMGIDRVGVEEPGLWFVPQVLALAGVTPVPVAVDAEGLNVDELDRLGARAVVVTPGHQFPLGMTMSARRRSELIDWARASDGWIVEDDYDGEFRYDRAGIGALQGLDPDRVVYLGTASKSLAPALRLAWLTVPSGLRAALATVKHLRGGVSAIDQLALADFVDRGDFDRHVRSVRGRYQHRHELLSERLHAIEWLDVPDHPAGLHLTCSFERDVSEADIKAAGRRASVGLMGLAPHWMGEPTLRGLVLGYSRPPEHNFRDALDRLAGVLDSI